HRDASALADRESTRAEKLRGDLVAVTRIVEEQRREIAAARAATIDLKVPSAIPRVEAAQPSASAAAIAPHVVSPAADPPPSLASLDQELAGAASIPTAGASDLLPAPAFEVLAALEAEIAHQRQQIA